MPGRLRLALPLLLLAAQPVTPTGATSFILEGGEVVEGRLVASTRNTLTVLRDIGGIRQIAAASLERVQVRSGSGELISGTLRALEDERLAIATATQTVVWIEGDRLVADPRPGVSADALAAIKGRSPKSAAPATAIKRVIRPAAAERPADAPSPLRDGGAIGGHGRPGAATAGDAGGQRTLSGIVKPAAAAPGEGEVPSPAAHADPPAVRIEASPEVGEKDGTVGFRFELSHVSEQPVRLVYATVDGQANAGRDYEAVRGVLTLEPGETGGTVETSILDDPENEDPEQFFLFVKPDGQSATIEQKWQTVTIQDDD
ncbi:MAG TPA: Calx-beta domain-containing protein [Geminicoccaceae bacterium]